VHLAGERVREVFFKGVPLCDKGSSREGLADGEEERRLGMGGHFYVIMT